jgi:hypothetical protein
MRLHKYLFLIGLLASIPSALAQNDETVAKAKEMFKRGAERFERGDYGGAISDFQSADQLIARPAFSFNLAKAYDKLHEPGRAIFYYRQYLDRDAHAGDRAQVLTETKRLQSELRHSGKALLIITSQPSGAAVTTEGAFVGATPIPLTVSDGNHLIHLELGGIAKDIHASVKPGDVHDVRVPMTPTQVAAAEPAPAPGPAPQPAETHAELKSNDDWSAPPAPAPAPATPPPAVSDVPSATPTPPPPLAVVESPPPSSEATNVRVVGQAEGGTVTKTAPERRSSALTVLKWTGVALTGASGVGLAYFGVTNLSAASQLNQYQNGNPNHITTLQAANLANSGNQAGQIANFGFIPATILLAAATTVLFIVDGTRN